MTRAFHKVAYASPARNDPGIEEDSAGSPYRRNKEHDEVFQLRMRRAMDRGLEHVDEGVKTSDDAHYVRPVRPQTHVPSASSAATCLTARGY
jgi:hypothetical protein